MKTTFHFYLDNIDGRHWNHAIRPNLVLIGMCLHGMEYRSERRRKCVREGSEYSALHSIRLIGPAVFSGELVRA